VEDLTDSVNFMAGNLRRRCKHRARHNGGRDGDLSKKITVDVKGEIAELKNTVNIMWTQLSSLRRKYARGARSGVRKESSAARRK